MGQLRYSEHPLVWSIGSTLPTDLKSPADIVQSDLR